MSADLTALVVADLAGELPPLTKRGVTVAWMGAHWFAGVTRLSSAAAVLDVLSGFILAPVVPRQRGGYGYGCSAGIGGASVYWSLDRPDVFVVLPGEVCEVLGVVNLVALASLADLEPTSRFDLAWDVEGIKPGDFRAAVRGGDVVSRVHFTKADSSKWVEDGEGFSTYYMGSRFSERMVRVYDRRGPTRLEMEWKGLRALQLWRRLLTVAEDGWSAEGMSELRAFIDFRDRSSGVRPDFCPLLPWWDEITAGAGRSCTCIPREARTLEDLQRWLHRQVAPVLALVLDASSDPELDFAGLIGPGRERYSRRPDRVALVTAARAQFWNEAAD